MPRQKMTKTKAMEHVKLHMNMKCEYVTFNVQWIDGHEVFMLYYRVWYREIISEPEIRWQMFIDGEGRGGGII